MSGAATGRTLGKYEVRGVLGKGAMGTVHAAWDPVIRRRVAIKTIPLPRDDDPETADGLARFKQEVQAAGRLSHPNIVSVFDYGETDDVAYIVMEFIEGQTLKDMLSGQQRLNAATTVALMTEVLSGLSFSHAAGVVHRDIKPANIMVTADGHAKIADFGIARIEHSSLTQDGTVMGTPAYMSPEQFMGQVVDHRTDIYSAGVMLYQMLTGERPFEGNMSSIVHKALNTTPPRPSDLAVTSPPMLDGVVARAMARRPEDRFATAAEFAQALRAPLPVAEDSTLADAETFVAPPRASDVAPPRASDVAPPRASEAAPGRGRDAGPRPANHRAELATIAPSRRPKRRNGSVLWAGAAAAVAVAGVAAWLLYPAATPRVQQASLPEPSQPVPEPPRPQPAALQQSAAATQPLPVPPPAVVRPPPEPAQPARPEPAQPTRPAQAATTARPGPALQPGPAVQPPAVQAPSAQPALVAPPALQPPPPPVAQQFASTEPGPLPGPNPQPAPWPPARPQASAEPPQSQGPAVPSNTTPLNSVPLPAAPPKAASAVEAALAATLPVFRCTLARATVGPDGSVTLHGAAGSGPPQDALRNAVDKAGASRIDWQVQGFDGPQCPALDTIRIRETAGRTQGAADIVQVGGFASLHDNDPIALQATMPAFAGYLHVTYIQQDATVLPLVPGPGYPAQTYAAHARIDLGNRRPGFEGWRVGPPFGTDMIIVIATTAPLFTHPLPDSQPMGAYLDSLRTAIDGLSQHGGSMSAAALVLDTLPPR